MRARILMLLSARYLNNSVCDTVIMTGVWYPSVKAARKDLIPDGVQSDHLGTTTHGVHNGYFVPLYAFIPSLLMRGFRHVEVTSSGANSALEPLIVSKLGALSEQEVGVCSVHVEISITIGCVYVLNLFLLSAMCSYSWRQGRFLRNCACMHTADAQLSDLYFAIERASTNGIVPSRRYINLFAFNCSYLRLYFTSY